MKQTLDPKVLISLLLRGCTDDADRTGWHAADFLYERGNVQNALIYAALFMPRFVEVEGEIFFADLGIRPGLGAQAFAERIRNARARSPEALAKLVNNANWLELPYVFRDRSGSDDAYRALAYIIAEAWSMRLSFLFPERTFKVRVINPEEIGSVIGVGFERAA